MWKLHLVCALLGVTHASTVVKRGQDPVLLPDEAQEFFTKTFRQTLFVTVKTAYDKAVIEKTELSADFLVCKDLIQSASTVCQDCAKEKCEPTFWEGIGNWIEHGFSDAGDWFDDLGDDFVNAQLWKDIEFFFEEDFTNFFLGIGDWTGWNDIEVAFQDMGDWFETAGLDMVDWFDDAGADIGGWFEGAGADIGNAFEDLGGWLGRRKRSVNLRSAMMLRSMLLQRKLQKMQEDGTKPTSAESRNLSLARRGEISDEVRSCMEQCDSCDSFLQDTDYLINNECGTDLLVRNTSIAADISKIMWVIAAANDTNDLIVVDTETGGDFDMSTWTMSETYLTAKFPVGEKRYLSEFAYNMGNPGKTAAECGIEYWLKYDMYDF